MTTTAAANITATRSPKCNCGRFDPPAEDAAAEMQLLVLTREYGSGKQMARTIAPFLKELHVDDGPWSGIAIRDLSVPAAGRTVVRYGDSSTCSCKSEA